MSDISSSSSDQELRTESCEARWTFSALYGTVTVIGIVLNAYILILLLIIRLRSAFIHFLVILSIVDLFVALTGPSRAFVQCSFEWNLRILQDQLCVIYTFISEFFVDVANYMKVLLAIMQASHLFYSEEILKKKSSLLLSLPPSVVSDFIRLH